MTSEETVVSLIQRHWTPAQKRRLKEWCADGWPIFAGEGSRNSPWSHDGIP